MKFTILFVLILMACQGQVPTQGPAYYQANADYLVFLVRGNSIAAGSGATDGPTTAAERVFEWDQTTDGLIDRATTEFSNANDGSPWKQFAIKMNELTGRKVVIIATALAGSELYPNSTGTDTHWDPMVDNAGAAVPGGTGSPLYTNAKNEADSCLLFLKKSKLDGIIDIIGVNDARGTASLALIRSGFTDFYDRTNTHFPGVPIYAATIGRPETNIINTRIASVKNTIRREADARSYYHIFCNLMSFDASAWGLYQGDNLHPTQAGNNLIGEMLVRYINYGSSETNKEVKQVWNCFKTERSAAHKAALKTWVEAQQANGNWDNLDSFIPAVGNAVEDVLVDFRLLGAPANIGFTFNANANIRVFGTSNYRNTRIIPQNSWIYGIQNDFIVGIKVLTNSTAAGTPVYLMGTLTNSPSRQIVIIQNATSDLAWFSNDNTATFYAPFTKVQDNLLHSVARTGGTTKAFYGDATQLATATQASTGIPADAIYEGVRNGAGTPNAGIDATIQYSFQALFTGFDLSGFISTTNTLMTALQTP